MHRRHAHTDTRKYRQVAPCACPICSKEFPREGPMKSHMTIVHGLAPATKKKPVQPAADKVFDCPICSHQFKMKAYLQRHLRVHAGTKPYICTLCAKCFTSSTNLAGHMAALHKEVDYTYNPLVNMVCNVAANGGIPQPSVVISRSTPSAPRKSGGSSRKSSSSRKNTQPAASTVVGDNFSTGTEAAPAAPSRNESVVGYTDDVLNMSREMQLMPRDMSSMLPVLSRDIPNMIPPVIARDMSNMPRDIQGLMVPREMANMPRDMSTMPRENPSIPQYAIGTMPTNWNYAYMGEFYRL
jgi:transcription elongation factor Elf1